MVMDPRLRGFIESINSNGSPVSDQHLTNILKLKQTCFDQKKKKKNNNFMDTPPPDPTTNFIVASTTTTTSSSSSSSSSSSCSLSPDEYYCPEDCDFSDVVLKYISKMLMEEDMEDKNCMFQESSALQAAEKPFYEILGEKYPPSSDCPPPPPPPPPYIVDDHNVESTQVDYFFTGSYSNPYVDHNIESTQVDYFTGSYSNTTSGGSSSSNGNNNNNNAVETNLIDDDLGDQYNHHHHHISSQVVHNFPTDYTFQATTSQSSLSSTHSVNSILDGLVDSPPVTSSSRVQVPDIFNDSQSFWQFQKGVEVANSFLPNDNDLIVSTESIGCFHQEPISRGGGYGVVVKMEKKDDREHSPTNGSRGKKNLHRVDIDLEEGRINKQSAVFKEETVRTPMFDSVLLCNGDKGEAAVSNLREALQTETSKNAQQQQQQQQQQSGHSKGSNGGKSRGNKKQQSGRKDMVDLRTLLIHCAQAVAADDRRSASELLKQIRQHSSPFGDGSQRLAHCFADGLEARLAGTGSQIYASLVNKKTSAADILKAYQLYLAACPFKKVSNFYSNQTIMNLAENATSLHIVDFGIYYGFQWPCLIQRLSGRPGGPPKLRITGIDLPQPGFRPAERIEETGRRLADYAESFNVPFEYTAIAKKWENIQVEDLKIDRDEVLVVNCMYRFRNLLDETVVLDSPRSAVLQLVRKMNPNIFIHGVVNGAFSAPFFVTRFREALFHYSALFDMLETNVPREHPERLLLEKDLFGREALNVIACEGSERVERPETYKQWQVRNMRAGFKQLPLNQEIMKKARERAKKFYHKDFVIDEDGQWLLQGWKGRIIYGLSTWRPVHNS